ncbi:ABC transporter substrate-binding protein [Alkalihalobacillus sp. LMS39]|uniref:ABC transporter substrate-binding protein n=1 Tax=Alkalihalobacillus sp. LMS39 TaxID=2924032 RepID=UPI001FB32F64|nr:ABC transporter substrate-binding protein [Alkalihalobacillus sp. LMS39]UOE95664.1 ABC transporter substrate-binding protein [Alkalihalobacillus sp. LMS39]
MKKKLGFWLSSLMMVLLLIGCGGGESSAPADPDVNNEGTETAEETPSNEETPDVSGEEEILNIGYSGPLSGPAAFYGENTVSGIRMAVEEINVEGFEVNGTTYKLNLVTLDDMYMPNESGTNARRLVQEYNTPVVFIPHSGGIFATQVFNEQENFIIGAYTSEQSVLEQGNELTLRIPPAYDMYPEPFVQYQQERFGKKLALLPTATQYGKDWTEALVPVWEAFGGEVVYDGDIDFGKDTDFFPIVTNALSQNPDVLFVGGPSEPTALLIKAARELGFEGGFMIMDQAKFEEMEPVLGGFDMLEGAVGTLPIVGNGAPGSEAIVEKYEAEHGRVPTAEAAFNYQAMYAFVEAMKLAGTVEDTKAIMEHLDAGVKAIPDELIVWHVTGVENQGMNWKGAVGAIEDGEIIPLTE